MEDTRKRQLAVIGFILVVSLFFAGFIYAVFFSSSEKSDWNNYQQRVAHSKADQAGKRTVSADVPILLRRDEVVSVGKLKFIYRGKNEGKIHIAVIIPALDPQAVYLHAIDADRAAEPLRLGGKYFRVISSRASRLKLERVKN
jgi:hypothetical protein